MRQAYVRLRDTTFDLYTEAEQLPWYYKAGSIVSAWIILAGYVLFAVAFTSPAEDLRVQPRAVSAIGTSCLFIGYISYIVLGLRSSSLLYIFDNTLLPVLSTSVVGIFTVIINRALYEKYDHRMEVHVLLPVITASIASMVSGVLATLVYMRLWKIKKSDARRRARASHTEIHSDSGVPMLPPGHRTLEQMVPDDEAQRRQLVRLLLARDKHASVEIDANSTYHIELPWENRPAVSTHTRSSSVPGRVSATDSIRDRLRVPFVRGRERNSSMGSNSSSGFKDPRERRREEIERSTLAARPSRSPDPNTNNPGWYGTEHTTSDPLYWNGGARYG